MPTYEFRCPNGHEFERIYRTISGAASEVPCPECGVTATRILSAGGGLVFKGSGFYLTDYGKNAHRKPAAGSGTKSDSGSGSDGGTKPEAKSESKGDKSESKGDKSESKGESKSDNKPAEGAKPKAPSPKPSSE